MSSIFSKKISSFCSSSRLYFFLSFPTFACKRTRIFYSTHITKWNNHFCSKIQRVLILLAQEIGNNTFLYPMYWFEHVCIQQCFSNFIGERNQIMLKKYPTFAFFLCLLLTILTISKKQDTVLNISTCSIKKYYILGFKPNLLLIFDQYFLELK